jgi:hypothetical protein
MIKLPRPRSGIIQFIYVFMKRKAQFTLGDSPFILHICEMLNRNAEHTTNIKKNSKLNS